MKFLIISEGGDGTGIASRLKLEGHDVRIWIRDPDASGRCEGLIDHATSYESDEIIVADCTGCGPILDSMRDHGMPVVGGSSIADELESNRTFATKVMKHAGIKVPFSKSFNDWEVACEFIKNAPPESRFVFKPEGKLSGVIPSQVTRNNEELLENIEHFKTLVGQQEPDFTLQEFIEGLALSTEGWFDGDKWLFPFNHTLERKQFLVGDLGPSGGCTGNIVWPCEYSDPLVQEGLAKIEGFLRENKYCGAIDLNAVVNEEGLYGLEFTPRFGYDALPTYMCGLYEGDFGSLLDTMSRGDGLEDMEIRDAIAVGVRVSIPPWPTEKHHAEAGVPIKGLKESNIGDWFYGYDIKSVEGSLYSSGGYGIIGVVNSYGDTIDAAFDIVETRLKRLKMHDLQYRNDLREVFKKDYRKVMSLTRELV